MQNSRGKSINQSTNQSKRKTSYANGQTNLGHKHQAPEEVAQDDSRDVVTMVNGAGISSTRFAVQGLECMGESLVVLG